ncbi:MAG: glutathione-regulated potassium-efflux system protein KefC [Gammaproteobacteria bacterium]|nr:glutathione-regulated potassium-efflux system protein KefC [Gammaproteobacteria bacterium]
MASSLLANVAIYLGATVVLVPLASYLGLGSIIGYLIAGVVIGPWGLGVITNVEEILHFAEFGVVLLLFLIGLEMNPRRLWAMRQPILFMGGGQVLLSTLLLWMVALLLGIGGSAALIAAMALSLSSTALALQTLREKNLLPTRTGNNAFSILLFQDIAVIPMLALIPLLASGGSSEPNGWLDGIKAVVVIAGIIIVGRYLNRPILRFIAKTRMREIFTAFALLLVIGISLLMQAVEMSMALGSFLAGVLLADSEYRHELELEIEPFKGLLLGLFFIAVGMGIDFAILLQQPLTVLLWVALLVLCKMAILWLMATIGKNPLPPSQRPLLAILLSQGGEFAFVIFSVARDSAVMSHELTALLTLVVAISIMSTPLLLLLQERFLVPLMQHPSAAPNIHPDSTLGTAESQANPIIIAGFGRFGRVVGRMLHANGIPMTILDHDPEQIEQVRLFGYKIYYGDATRPDTLHAAGAEQAKLLIIALDDPEDALLTLQQCKKHFPHLKVLARCDDMVHGFEMLHHGVDYYQREILGSAMALGEAVLREMGYGAYRAKRAMHTFRKHDLHLFSQLFASDSLDKHISITKQAREELLQIFIADEEEIAKRSESGWDR